jgi:AcrR family transcriptional regulator
MATKSPPKRDTFRHGNLLEALVDAALERLEAERVESISLRDLAADVGVNHRAVYRHFPDKLSLLALVAERGWRRLAQRIEKSAAGHAPGEATLIAGGVGFFLFARDNPNLFHLMAGARLNAGGRFPDLDNAVVAAFQIFARAFVETGTAPAIVIERTTMFAAALQGVITQILHRRLRVAPAKAKAYVAEVSRMLVKGIR